MAIGHCSQTHTDLMLTELENIAKWEHTRRTAGFLSYLKVCIPILPNCRNLRNCGAF